jgi:hypothetical protein
MIKFLIKILLLSVPFYIIFVCGLFFLPTTLDSNSMLYSSIDKRERLKNIKTPKMVFIAGSSMAFGLDSKLIEDKFNYPVVNMGIHAGIGLHYMISEVKPYLKKGDIVVIGAEYIQFDINGVFYGHGVLAPLVFDIHEQDYKKLDFIHATHLFSQIANYDLKKIKSFVLFKKRSREIDTIYNTETIKNYVFYNTKNVYVRSGFNKYGDIIGHWRLVSANYDIDKKDKIELPSIEVIEFLFDFKQEMKDKGVKVLFVPPPYEIDCFRKNKENIMEITKKLEEYQLDYISPASRYAFSDSLFYDTRYHLNKKGVDKRTQYLIEDISKYIK